MIRLEFSVEAMQKDIEHSRNKVTIALDNLQKEKTILEETLQLKSGKISTDLAVAVQDTKIKIEEKMKTIETEKEQWQSKLKDVVKKPAVLFSARDPKQFFLRKNLVMVFKGVILNEGTGYNKDSGVFTAPYNGVYTFSVQLCVQGGIYVDFAFMANNKYFKTTRIQLSTSSSFSCHNYDAITILRSNDEVKIEVLQSTTSGRILHESLSNYWTMFSGCLTFAT